MWDFTVFNFALDFNPHNVKQERGELLENSDANIRQPNTMRLTTTYSPGTAHIVREMKHTEIRAHRHNMSRVISSLLKALSKNKYHQVTANALTAVGRT